MSAVACRKYKGTTKDTLYNSILEIVSRFVQARVTCSELAVKLEGVRRWQVFKEGRKGFFGVSRRESRGLRRLTGIFLSI